MKKEKIGEIVRYLIVGVLEGNFTVYRISQWQENATNGEMAILYNYSKNNKIVNSNYLLENEFIDTFNFNEDENIKNLADISFPNIELLSKALYREKTVVKEFKK